MGSRETPIQKQITDFLKSSGIFHCRINSGMFRVGKRVIRTAPKGFPDLIAIIPPLGRCLAIEVKAPGGKQSPDQKVVEQQFASSGSVYIIAECVEDVQDALYDMGMMEVSQ